MIVTTLPISYREGRSFKIFYSSFIAKCISRLCLAESLFPVNLMGLKDPINPSSYLTVTHGYRNCLDRLELLDDNSTVVNDTDYLFQDYLLKTISRDISSGKCFFRQTEISFCECGKVELPYEVLIRLSEENRMSLIRYRDKQLACSFCGTFIQRKHELVLMRRFRKDELPHFETVSPFFSTRVNGIMQRVVDEPSMISRSHRSNQGFIKLENGLIIDPDYCWAHSLAFLRKINTEREFALVVGANQIYHACKVIASTSDHDQTIKISLVVAPLINMASLDKRLDPKMTTDDLINFFRSPQAVSIFLSLFLQWNRLETSMGRGNVEIVASSLRASQSLIIDKKAVKEALSVSSALNQLNQKNIASLLRKIRQHIDLSSSEQCLFQAIT